MAKLSESKREVFYNLELSESEVGVLKGMLWLIDWSTDYGGNIYAALNAAEVDREHFRADIDLSTSDNIVLIGGKA